MYLGQKGTNRVFTPVGLFPFQQMKLIVYSSLSGLFVLSWNRRIISTISFYGARVLGSYIFCTQFQTGKAWSLQILKVKTPSQSPTGQSHRDMCLQGCSVFEIPVFWINHSKHKINKHIKFLSTCLYKPYNSSFRIFFSFIY